MTQVELPQLQIGRYIDLLRRRRWQLLPAALVGLAVGSLVAILIPRYYVAETIVRIQPRSTDQRASRQDRFIEETRKARIVIKNEQLISEAIRELEWLEASRREDSDALRELCAEIADRIEVEQLWEASSAASSAMLQITYKDRDGPKSAEFLNKLRDLYLDAEFSSILKAERNRLTELKNQEDRHTKALESAFNDKLDVLRRSGISTGLRMVAGGKMRIEDERLSEFRVVDGEIADLRAQIAGLSDELQARRLALSRMDPKKVVDPDNDPRVRTALAPLNETIRERERQLDKLATRHATYDILQSDLKKLKDKREEYIRQLEAAGKLDDFNPDYVDLQRTIEGLAAKIGGLRTQLKVREDRHKDLDQFRQDLPDYQTSLEKAEARIEEEMRQLEQVHDRQREQEDKVSQLELNQSEVVDVLRPAWTPPEPTYPNKILIAALGALLGLGAAVGSIFFLDLAHPSFKSYDEVARSLPIPVLGGVSYLELEEDLKAARRKRFRIGSLAIFIVALFASILALYFLAPLRLPPFLRSFFDMIFHPGS